MFSILNILKKNKEEKLKGSSIVQQPPVEEKTKPAQDEISALNSCPVVSDVSISSALNRGITEENLKQVNLWYQETLGFIHKLYSPELAGITDVKKTINQSVDRAVGLLKSGSKESIRICLSDYSEEEFLYCHVLNVCLLSIEMGLWFGYDNNRLVELGTAAILHDIGTIRYIDIVNKRTKFTEDEYRQVKQHPAAGLEILNRIDKEFPMGVFDAVSQEHERCDGTGYPKALKENGISESAQIIGLLDVYEAMMHKRPYRDKLTPTQTMNTILGNKSAFAYKAIKGFIERIGIFPLGSLVRLNTQEKAVVIKDNLKSPLRPIVSVLFDHNGRELTQPKNVDLASCPVVFIEECLDCMKRFS